MKKVLVIGSINEDMSFRLSHLPQGGETIAADSLKVSHGGKGANQAVALARMGAEVAMIGCVGSDDVGSHIQRDLNDEGIDTQGILKSDKNTGIAIINVDDLGENSIVYYPGANYELTVEDLEAQKEFIATFDYCLFQFELPLEVIYYAIDLCHELGVKTVLNPAPYNHLFNKDYLSKLDYFIPNEIEFADAMNLEGEFDVFSQSKHFYDQYQCKLIITLGSRGSLLTHGDTQELVDIVPTDVVDTTAAGDTYIGAFMSAIARGLNEIEAMKLATKASSKCVSKAGAQDSIPYLNDILL